MIDDPNNIPERIEPYILLDDHSRSVPLASGPFRLTGLSDGVLDGDLVFRWFPSTAIEFEGSYTDPHPDIEAPNWCLLSEGTLAFSMPALVTHVSVGNEKSTVRGIAQRGFSVGSGSFDTLRFCLANFPNYIGAPISYHMDAHSGWVAGRLQIRTDRGECRLDVVPEATELVKRAGSDQGFVISHVGQWIPSSGVMTVEEAEAIIVMLHFWFGFTRGAWAGPLFPQGLSNGNIVWHQFAAWRLGDSPAATWMPQRRPLDLSSAFRGFAQRWNDHAWQGALQSAISWFIEANSSRTALESKIVLAQVALELLAWVHVIETQRLHGRTDFRRLSAAGRIRILLQHIGVRSTLPDYLSHLPALQNGEAFDGPGVITRVRNALVHATEENRETVDRIDGIQLYECGQMALQYVELTLLAICGHDGHYARRGWRGWVGDDEVRVPWKQAG